MIMRLSQDMSYEEASVRARTWQAVFVGDADFRELIGKNDGCPEWAVRGLWLSTLGLMNLTRGEHLACVVAAPSYALINYSSCLRGYDPRTIDACVNSAPRAALMFCPDELTVAQIDRCAAMEPRHAMQFAAHRLSPARLDACAEHDPRSALGLIASLLTPERRAWCREAVAFADAHAARCEAAVRDSLSSALVKP